MKFNFKNPYHVMYVPLLMYLFEAPAKVVIGWLYDLPAVFGDGLHNASDFVQVCVILGGVYVSRRPADEKHKLGRMNIESILSLAIGLSLGGMALYIAFDSVMTLLGYRTSEAASLPAGHAFSAAALAMVSGVISLFVSRFQIRAGQNLGYELIVNDGLETRGDAYINFTVFAGILGQYLLGFPQLGSLLAIYVAWKMGGTAKEILVSAYKGITQATIGLHHESDIREITLNVTGVRGVPELITFRVGPKVILMMKVITRAQPQAHLLIKRAIAKKIKAYLLEQGFVDGKFDIRFETPPANPHRIAVALNMPSPETATVPTSLRDLTHVVVADIQDGDVACATPYSRDEYLASPTFLKDRHAVVLLVFDPNLPTASMNALQDPQVLETISKQLPIPAVVSAITSDPRVLDLGLERASL